MRSRHVATVIIGAGQAGLSAAYHLRRRGVECLVVDRISRIGDQWRERYDSLRLFTPASADGLDGLRFPGYRQAFPTKDAMADYLELYAQTHKLPVQLDSHVRRLTTGPDGGYVVEVDHKQQRERMTCDSVVLATGTFGQEPGLPPFADQLDPTIHQVHSIRYHGPADLPPGPVLVVGASHSGLDIALELGADRETTLVGPARGNLPVEWDSRFIHAAFPHHRLRFPTHSDATNADRAQVGRQITTSWCSAVPGQSPPCARLRRGMDTRTHCGGIQ